VSLRELLILFQPLPTTIILGKQTTSLCRLNNRKHASQGRSQ
jgi:hypothetical protein